MTEKDKELLLEDLSARLPYHVKCKVWLKYGTTEEGLLDLEHNYGDVLQDAFFYTDRIKDIKPYLRPMSSMPEEEREFLNRMALENSLKCIEEEDPQKVFLLRVKHDAEELSYLYKHHYDVNGLIPKGLAIEVTEDNNPYKD